MTDADDIFETLQELFAAYVAYAAEHQKLDGQRDENAEGRLLLAWREFCAKVKRT